MRTLFDELKPPLVELIAELRERDVDDSFLHGDFPPDRQRALVARGGRALRAPARQLADRPDRASVRVRRRAATTSGSRRTTTPTRSSRSSRRCTSTATASTATSCRSTSSGSRPGRPCSLGIHESQSRLWENLVGRSLPFWRLFYPRLQATYPEQLGGVDLERFHAGIHAVQPGLIRIQADEVTYGMHVMLRFELEQDIVEGRVELRDLPQRWNEKMWDYLGVEVPDDGHGVLQDVHWSGGSIGYFSTYLIGTVASVQIWEAVRRDVPELEEQVGNGEFTPLREWLGEHVHALGRKFSPQETLRRATGSAIAASRISTTSADSYA